MFRRFKFPRRRVFLSWMGSYALILLIPIIISTFLYIQSGGVLEKEINRNNAAFLKQLQQTIDSQMLNIDRMSFQLAINPKVISLIHHEGSFGREQQPVVYAVLKDLIVYKTVNSFVDDFYIYFKDSDATITSTTLITDPRHMFQTYHETEEGLSYEQWHQYMQQKHNGDFRIMDRRMENGATKKVVAYSRSLPVNVVDKSYATALIMIDQQWFREAMGNLQGVNQGAVWILNANNQIVASIGSEQLLDRTLQYSELSEPSEIMERLQDGEEVTISYTSSDINGWKYISALPSSVFMEKAQYIRNLTFAGLLICLVIGIVASYLLARRNYNPVNQLVQALSEKASESLEQAKDEYSFIRNAISTTFDENEQIHKRLEEQKLALRANFLVRLVKGRLETNFPIDEALSSYQIHFSSPSYAVMLFYIEDFSGVFRQSRELDSENKMNFVHLIIRNIVEEISNRKHLGIVVESDGMLACLVNLQTNNFEKTRQELLDMALEAQQFIQNKFFIYFTVSISDIHNGFGGIPKAYQQALEAMEYKVVTGINRIIPYSELSPTAGFKLDYSLETELQLINCIKIGEFAKARDTIEDIFSHNVMEGTTSVEMTKLLMFEMIGTLMKTLYDMPALHGESLINTLHPVQRLVKCDTVPEMKNEMIFILKEVCTYVESNKKSHNVQLRDDVLAFIHHNYQNINLSVASIADHFRMNQRYLSQFFREQTGDGLLDAINKVRLEQAKKLLEEGWSITDTATRVGYINSSKLIRAFKRYEGITPGQYKAKI